MHEKCIQTAFIPSWERLFEISQPHPGGIGSSSEERGTKEQTAHCIAWSCDERKDVLVDNKFVLTKSYYDETYFKMPVHDSEIILCNRKMSTYINALAKAGFMVEQFIEETDSASLKAAGDIDIKTQKAKMMPLSFCIKARKI